jgi:hypothetical protein
MLTSGLPLFEIALVLVRVDQFARRIVNANHSLIERPAVGCSDWLDGWGLPCNLNANPTEGATRQRQFGEVAQHTVLARQAPEYSHRLNRPP